MALCKNKLSFWNGSGNWLGYKATTLGGMAGFALSFFSYYWVFTVGLAGKHGKDDSLKGMYFIGASLLSTTTGALYGYLGDLARANLKLSSSGLMAGSRATDDDDAPLRVDSESQQTALQFETEEAGLLAASRSSSSSAYRYRAFVYPALCMATCFLNTYWVYMTNIPLSNNPDITEGAEKALKACYEIGMMSFHILQHFPLAMATDYSLQLYNNLQKRPGSRV